MWEPALINAPNTKGGLELTRRGWTFRGLLPGDGDPLGGTVTHSLTHPSAAGRHMDGAWVWAGMAAWSLGRAPQNRCSGGRRRRRRACSRVACPVPGASDGTQPYGWQAMFAGSGSTLAREFAVGSVQNSTYTSRASLLVLLAAWGEHWGGRRSVVHGRAAAAAAW